MAYNPRRLKKGVTFLANDKIDVKKLFQVMEEMTAAHRESDRLLFESGMMDKTKFYSNELTYSRLERVILAFKAL